MIIIFALWGCHPGYHHHYQQHLERLMRGGQGGAPFSCLMTDDWSVDCETDGRTDGRSSERLAALLHIHLSSEKEKNISITLIWVYIHSIWASVGGRGGEANKSDGCRAQKRGWHFFLCVVKVLFDGRNLVYKKMQVLAPKMERGHVAMAACRGVVRAWWE